MSYPNVGYNPSTTYSPIDFSRLTSWGGMPGATGLSPDPTSPDPLSTDGIDSSNLPDAEKQRLEDYIKAANDPNAIQAMPPEMQRLLQMLHQAENNPQALKKLLQKLESTNSDLNSASYNGMSGADLAQMMADYYANYYSNPNNERGRALGSLGTQGAPVTPTGPAVKSTAGATGTPDIKGFQNLDAEQKANAKTIIDEGKKMGASQRDIQIALMTAMQESSLHNLPGGDRDSVGLFQQRPSCGWGSWSQCHDPTYAADTFYKHLMAIGNRDSMSLTAAAQAVQGSAFPDAYAKWQDLAAGILQNIPA